MQDNNTLTGFLLINKPKGITSFACIARIKKIIGQKIKIGHAGTLDPMATGLLIVGIGREATRHLSQIMKLDKVYTATGKLGELTPTLDYESAVVQTCDTCITKQELVHAINQLGSAYIQIPPVYSALKHEGQALHQLARHNLLPQEVLHTIAATKSRMVQLYAVELGDVHDNMFTIRAHVSHGTYIRSLVNDIAQRAGSYAATTTLERSVIGPFNIAGAVDIHTIATLDSIGEHLITVEALVDTIKSYLNT